jgi:hypothetical protein
MLELLKLAKEDFRGGSSGKDMTLLEVMLNKSVKQAKASGSSGPRGGGDCLNTFKQGDLVLLALYEAPVGTSGVLFRDELGKQWMESCIKTCRQKAQSR